MKAAIGVDVGATTISGGLVTHEGEILHSVQTPTRGDGPETALERLLGVIDELLRFARDDHALSLAGVGVGVAGVVDPATNTMLHHVGNGLPDLAHLPLAQDIRRVTGLPAFVDNDANALALAEWIFGVGRGVHSLVLLALGTNVGGAVIMGDALIRGYKGYAGEFHSAPVNFDEPCPTLPYGRGGIGDYVGGQALAAAARKHVGDGAGAVLLELAGGDRSRISSELVFQAARYGDPVAKAVIDRACEALAAGIGFIVNGFNPEVVVVTGGVARSLVPLEAELRLRAGGYALAPALASTRIHVIGGEKRQTVRGGAALVLYELERARTSGKA